MTHHARSRAKKYYGVRMSGDDQHDMLARIARGEGARLREYRPPNQNGKDKLPIYLICWPRIARAIYVVVRDDLAAIVTVLPPECDEVRWRFGVLFA